MQINETVMQTAMDYVHRLIWNLRFEQTNKWSPVLLGVSHLDLHVMKLIAERPDMQPKDISTKLRIPASTLSSAINRMEKRGLLERQISPHDKRSFQLVLTAEGWNLKREHDQVDRLVTTALLEALENEAEVDVMVKLLGKITYKLEEIHDNPEDRLEKVSNGRGERGRP